MDCLNTTLPALNDDTFNSILLSSLYSQCSQQVVLDASKTWDPSNEFLTIIKNLIVNYKTAFSELAKINTTTEQILLQIIREKKEWFRDYILALNENLQQLNPTQVLSMISQPQPQQSPLQQPQQPQQPIVYKEKWYQDYISNFYKLLNVSCFTIIYDSENKTYLIDNFKSNNNYGEIKKEIDDLPKIIIFYHSNLNDKSAYFIKKYNILKNMFPQQAENLKLSNYNISINGLDTCNDTIIFNCQQYKLDSCLIDNKFSTVGITCNNRKIVYNNNQLVDFNWNYNKTQNVANKFCFKRDQEIEECITFNEGVRLYVYVKNDNKETVQSPAVNKTVYDTSPKTVNEIILALAKMIQDNKQL